MEPEAREQYRRHAEYALTGLSQTPSLAAMQLRAMGIDIDWTRGSPKQCGRCPVSEFLFRQFPDVVGVETSYSGISRLVFPGHVYVHVPLPDHVMELVHYVDGHNELPDVPEEYLTHGPGWPE